MIDSKSAERMHRAGTLVAAAMICGSLIASGFTPLQQVNVRLRRPMERCKFGSSTRPAKQYPKQKSSLRYGPRKRRSNRIASISATTEGKPSSSYPPRSKSFASGPAMTAMHRFGQLWPQAANGHPPLPKEFTYSLNKGTTMGGVIRNDEGQPIAGAKSKCDTNRAAPTLEHPRQPGTTIGSQTTKTPRSPTPMAAGRSTTCRPAKASSCESSSVTPTTSTIPIGADCRRSRASRPTSPATNRRRSLCIAATS